MATFNDLLLRVRYDLSEIQAVTWSDDELFTYLKEGYKFIHQIIASEAPEWLVEVETYTVSSSEDVPTIDVPANTMYIYFICNSDGKQLIKVPIQDCYYYLLNETPSSIKFWARQKNLIIFAPKPSADTTIYLFRIPYPEEIISVSDTVPLDEVFHQFIVEYAVIRAHNRNERPTLVEQNFMTVKLDAIRSVLNKESSLQSINPNINWNI